MAKKPPEGTKSRLQPEANMRLLIHWALTGWGLAKGWGWQAYLMASFIHGLSNYSAILLQTGRLTIVQTETLIAVIAVILFGAAMWLRWGGENNISIDKYQESTPNNQ